MHNNGQSHFSLFCTCAYMMGRDCYYPFKWNMKTIEKNVVNQNVKTAQ